MSAAAAATGLRTQITIAARRRGRVVVGSSPQTRRGHPNGAAVAMGTRRYSSRVQGEAGMRADAVGGDGVAAAAPAHLNAKEAEIWGKLTRELEPTKLEVQDVSGGCGSMYAIEVVSERFRGLGMLGQQRLVNKVLGEEIRGWHGVQLRTGVP